MQINVELFDMFIERKSRNYISLLEINKRECLLYLEWGQGWKMQIGFLFGLYKNY